LTLLSVSSALPFVECCLAVYTQNKTTKNHKFWYTLQQRHYSMMTMKWVRIVFWNLWFYLEWNTKMSTQFNHTLALAIRITTMWIQSTFKVISTFDLIVDWLVSLIGVVRILMLLKSDMSWNTTLIHTRRLSSRYLNTTPPKIKITTLNFIWFTFLVSRWFVDLWFIY
jgi:hypothetical protein